MGIGHCILLSATAAAHPPVWGGAEMIVPPAGCRHPGAPTLPTMSRLPAHPLCCFVLLLLASLAQAQTPLNMSIPHLGYWTGSSGSPQVIFSDTHGAASFGPRIVVQMSRSSNPAPPPPYRLVLTLGPGFTALTPLALPADTSCQPATGGGAAPIQIECVRNTLLPGGAQQFQFALDAGPIALFSGSAVSARATINYEAFPLPEPPVCTNTSGNTGCVEKQANVFASWIGLDSLSIADPVTIGVDTQLRVNHRVVGYDGGRISTTQIDLPPELQYIGVSSPTAPTHTCNSSPLPGGNERVSCQGNIRHISANGEQRTGYFFVIVRTRPGVQPPGPLRVVASIGNGAQPAPVDCDPNPDQLACADVVLGLAAPPVVDLHLVASTAPLPYTRLGPAQGPFRIEYRNAGGAASATPTRLLAKLPAGFAYVQLGSTSGPVSCTASGSIEDGQEVRCQRSTSVPANSSTFWLELVLQGDPLLAAPVDNVLVWAIADGPGSDGDALLACAADPDRTDCRWQPFDVRPPCPGGPLDSIYCDDFELFVVPDSPGTESGRLIGRTREHRKL